MIRVGVIGTGRHGSRYANHIINDCDGLQLTAIARRSKKGKEQAELWRVDWHENWNELVASEKVDAVICAVPPVMNIEIAGRCSDFGKPLLVEKPLAVSQGEGVEILRKMEKSGSLLTVGQTLRYNPVIRKLKSEFAIRGPLYTVYANQRLEAPNLPWLDDPQKAGAGVSFHTAVHVFDALHYITGQKIVRVFAMCRTLLTRYCEDIVHVMFEMENGTSGVADFSKLSNGRSGRYEFVFADSQLQGDQIFGNVCSISGNIETELEKFELVPTIPPLLNDWSGFLNGKRGNPVTPEDGLYTITVSDACIRSSAEKRWVDLG